MVWWVRPLVRIIAAVLLPLVVPAVITLILWALPGDPAAILCPPGICEGTQALRERFHLDQGPWGFYITWLGNAVRGDFGRSWRVYQGLQVSELLRESIPKTALLLLIALVPLSLGSIGSALGWLPKFLDWLWQGLGLIPAVILALLFAAWIEVTYGAMSLDGLGGTLRLLAGGLVLGVADGALAGMILGTRQTFTEEVKQRYIQIALMRGETVLGNALPNVLPALTGQLRSRVLHVLSGAVVVEVVLNIPGLGDLLWDGTLMQDFGVVLAAAWGFSLLSGALLLVQAIVEIAVALVVRYSPRVQS